MARQAPTRERLVRTAGELFWSQGYAGTGVSLIIERAQATSGSFYHFFATKDDLLLAVLDEVADNLEAVLSTAAAAAAAPVDRIARVAEAYRQSLEGKPPAFGLPLGSLTGELGADHADARARLAGLVEVLVSRVESWLAEAAETLPAAADSRRLAEQIVASLEGAAAMARAGGDAGVLDRVAAELGCRLEPEAASSGFRRRPAPARRDSDALDWRAW
jgi:TetR/AcrR family transcriptional repressor of nem operon